jgi:hypothetical protein
VLLIVVQRLLENIEFHDEVFPEKVFNHRFVRKVDGSVLKELVEVDVFLNVELEKGPIMSK